MVSGRKNDGSKVLYSRDYKPLWRLLAGKNPERLQPWVRIKRIESQNFWDDSNTPWWSSHRREEEEQRLLDFGIRSLPKLVDTLPDLVFSNDILWCRTEEDGSKVLYSRDYKPLWRLLAGKNPERLQPWVRIKRIESQNFWTTAILRGGRVIAERKKSNVF